MPLFPLPVMTTRAHIGRASGSEPAVGIERSGRRSHGANCALPLSGYDGVGVALVQTVRYTLFPATLAKSARVRLEGLNYTALAAAPHAGRAVDEPPDSANVRNVRHDQPN